MKKMILILLLISSSVLYSQGGWELVYSGNISSYPVYRDINFINETTGFTLTNFGLLKTTNSSQTWNQIIIPGQTGQIYCYYILNENNIWVLTDHKVNYTSNGGTNWNIIDTTIAEPMSVSFINALSGWVCGNNGMIKKTINGGLNWISSNSGIIEHLRSISFNNANNGICAGDWGKILSTTNGGTTWNVFTDPYQGFFKHTRFNGQNAYVSGSGVNIYRTVNNGINWNLTFVNASVISSINFNPQNHGFAFGSATDFFKTINNGSSWERMNSNGLNPAVFGSAITPNGTIWIAADSSMILNSTNSGAGWNEIIRNYITGENLNSVYFTDQFSGFACGNKGVLIKSTNGGVNWKHTGLNEPGNLKSVKFTDNYTGYICGGNGTSEGVIYRTTDFGASWVNQFRDSSHLNSICFINSQTGWAAGVKGTFLKTTNSGINWVRESFQDTTINNIYFINNNTGFICSRKIFKTTNSGLNWYQVLNDPSIHLQVTGNIVYAISRLFNVSYLNRSTDLGETWSSASQGNGLNFSFHFVNSETGWLSNGSVIRRTTNGGNNWSIQPGTGISVLTMYFSDPVHGWAAGTGGSVIRTITGGIGITPISTEIPIHFNLYQNYPNPFNPSTKIRFQIPAFAETTRRVISLRIYDVLGKEIAVLVNENLKPGIYEIDWNAENLPSGVYFYSLITNEFTQTKKMVVLK